MVENLSLSGIFMGVALCVVTHGVFISTGFEGVLHDVFSAGEVAGHELHNH